MKESRKGIFLCLLENVKLPRIKFPANMFKLRPSKPFLCMKTQKIPFYFQAQVRQAPCKSKTMRKIDIRHVEPAHCVLLMHLTATPFA